MFTCLNASHAQARTLVRTRSRRTGDWTAEMETKRVTKMKEKEKNNHKIFALCVIDESMRKCKTITISKRSNRHSIDLQFFSSEQKSDTLSSVAFGSCAAQSEILFRIRKNSKKNPKKSSKFSQSEMQFVAFYPKNSCFFFAFFCVRRNQKKKPNTSQLCLHFDDSWKNRTKFFSRSFILTIRKFFHIPFRLQCMSSLRLCVLVLDHTWNWNCNYILSMNFSELLSLWTTDILFD